MTRLNLACPRKSGCRASDFPQRGNLTANSNTDGLFGIVHRKSRRAQKLSTMVKKEISVNEHFLVPEHRKLSPEEKEAILKKYNATDKQLPKISIKDPALRILEPKEGDLIEIKRKVLESKDFYLYYRIVA